jgi:hypothetical protein
MHGTQYETCDVGQYEICDVYNVKLRDRPSALRDETSRTSWCGPAPLPDPHPGCRRGNPVGKQEVRVVRESTMTFAKGFYARHRQDPPSCRRLILSCVKLGRRGLPSFPTRVTRCRIDSVRDSPEDRHQIDPVMRFSIRLFIPIETKRAGEGEDLEIQSIVAQFILSLFLERTPAPDHNSSLPLLLSAWVVALSVRSRAHRTTLFGPGCRMVLNRVEYIELGLSEPLYRPTTAPYLSYTHKPTTQTSFTRTLSPTPPSICELLPLLLSPSPLAPPTSLLLPSPRGRTPPPLPSMIPPS